MDKTYRQMNCIEQCINKEIKDMYNCSIPSFYKSNGLEECGGKLLEYNISKQSELTNIKFKSLDYENHINYIMNLTKQFYHVCEIKCPHIFESVLFNTQGMSFLNMFEIFEFLIEAISVIFSK